MAGFQRARSAEQRAERRRAILDTASAMLAEMPVAEVGLNELARRVGLAKSNVLRYYDSREAVLLELLDLSYRRWVEVVRAELAGVGGDLPERRDRMIATFVTTLAADPVLCDLFSAQAAVLERNVSVEVAVAYKRGSLESTAALAEVIGTVVPELGADGALRFCAAALMSAGALWTHTHPAPAMLEVYERHPELATFRIDFAPTLTDVLTVLVKGLLAD